MVFLLFLTTAGMAAGLCGIAYFLKEIAEQNKRHNDILEKSNAPAPAAPSAPAAPETSVAAEASA